MGVNTVKLFLFLLNNPHCTIKPLDCPWVRSNYQHTLTSNGIRVDFGYEDFKEDNNSIFLKFEDYGKTWEVEGFCEY